MLIAAIALTLVLGGPPSSVAPNAPAAAPPASPLPAGLFVTDAPKDAKPVKEAKAAAKQGEPIVLVGRVGGRKEPFVRERAIMVLADPALKPCNELPGDTCKFPWDYCCESKETLKANVITVQVVGADGKPIKVTLRDAGGLVPLSLVTVRGTVREVRDGAVVVDAAAIYVAPPKP
jgi:hypothetical protein